MPQFTLYENTNQHTKDTYPFLLDVQNDLLEALDTRVVIPLCPTSMVGKKPITHLSPRFKIQGFTYTLLTPQLAGIAVTDLGPTVGNLSEYRTDIINALDFLFTGF
jgi:toxin CcdB